MKIVYKNFGGPIGFYLQKYFPNICSSSFLKLQLMLRERSQRKYITDFLSSNTPPLPKLVNIETINRCNNDCAFCNAARSKEKRPLKKMKEELFYEIIRQLKEWNFKGHLSLYVNNEPFLDNRIISFYKYARENLHDSFVYIFTNGTLLTVDKLLEIAKYVDLIVINNYCKDMKLHDNIKTIVDYLNNHRKICPDVTLLIQMRYSEAVLANRSGVSPNKNLDSVISNTCVLPFTDLTIVPDGKVIACCSDVLERTDLGRISSDQTLKDVWCGEKFNLLRTNMEKGRNNIEFCKYCDFVDNSFRKQITKNGI